MAEPTGSELLAACEAVGLDNPWAFDGWLRVRLAEAPDTEAVAVVADLQRQWDETVAYMRSIGLLR